MLHGKRERIDAHCEASTLRNTRRVILHHHNELHLCFRCFQQSNYMEKQPPHNAKPEALDLKAYYNVIKRADLQCHGSVASTPQWLCDCASLQASLSALNAERKEWAERRLSLLYKSGFMS